MDVIGVPDPIFADARLAALYDVLEAPREDLDLYVDLVREFGATSVIDVGCGTGTFACRLADRGLNVTGVDPAAASLRIARRKPGAERVRWHHSHLPSLPASEVDLITMTGNVAQVFVDDESWRTNLDAAAVRLRVGGHLVFETRDPGRTAWHDWNPDRSFRRIGLDHEEQVEVWVETTEVALPLVSLRWNHRFSSDGAVLTSDSTLRFRGREEIIDSIGAAGFELADVLDAPDRPGLEWVFVATRR